MQVDRGHILITIGMLCNPKFHIQSTNQHFGLNPTMFIFCYVQRNIKQNPKYFLYPLTSFT